MVEVFRAVSPGNPDAAGHDQVHITAFSPATRNPRVVGAVGAPALRRYLVAAWPADRSATVVSLAAYVGPSCTIGAGTVIVPGAVLTVDVVVGEHCQVNIGTTLSQDLHLVSLFELPGPSSLPFFFFFGRRGSACIGDPWDGWLDAR